MYREAADGDGCGIFPGRFGIGRDDRRKKCPDLIGRETEGLKLSRDVQSIDSLLQGRMSGFDSGEGVSCGLRFALRTPALTGGVYVDAGRLRARRTHSGKQRKGREQKAF